MSTRCNEQLTFDIAPYSAVAAKCARPLSANGTPMIVAITENEPERQLMGGARAGGEPGRRTADLAQRPHAEETRRLLVELSAAAMSTNDPVRTGSDATAGAPTELRTVFSAFPSGVVAVCAQLDRHPVGMAVSSFTPVSLHPPLISVCIQRTSSTWPRLREAPNLGVSVLGEHHERACQQLARKDGERFDGVGTVVLSSGSIHLRESCAWFDCSIESEFTVGDHLIVVLRIQQAGLSNATAPLVFHRSRFRRLAEAS